MPRYFQMHFYSIPLHSILDFSYLIYADTCMKREVAPIMLNWGLIRMSSLRYNARNLPADVMTGNEGKLKGNQHLIRHTDKRRYHKN